MVALAELICAVAADWAPQQRVEDGGNDYPGIVGHGLAGLSSKTSGRLDLYFGLLMEVRDTDAFHLPGDCGIQFIRPHLAPVVEQALLDGVLRNSLDISV